MEKISMMSADLQKAIDSLQIRDVYSRKLTARCKDDFDPKCSADLESLTIQTMHHVAGSVVIELDGQEKVLRVTVELGARWIAEESNLDETDQILVKATIEASFIAEYSMNTMLEKASIDEFSLKNVSYHVWPYWREFLSSQCDRMHLPRVVLPMIQLADNRHTDQAQNKQLTEENLSE